MIYFIHDVTSRTIKIGCARDPRQRLSTLQISTSNRLVLLGAIAGTERTEKKVHALVGRQCAPKPGESFTRPLRLNGDWFDDRILPFVTELIHSPQQYLDVDKKPSAPRPAPVTSDPSIRQCKMVLAFDSGEQYQEHYIFRAASPELAMTALQNVAAARVRFLANTVRLSTLSAAGLPTRKIDLRGLLVTAACSPREGLSVIANSEPGSIYSTIRGVKQYSLRWFHGVPEECLRTDNPWQVRPTAQLDSLLQQFARVLTQQQCVISAQNPLVVRGLLSRGFGLLPKGELRSKVNQKAARQRRSQRVPEKTASATVGLVYFIQDTASLAIKIGFCLRKPDKRLAALQTGNANALKLLGHVSGTLLHEKHLHAHLAQFHIQGEWFSSGALVHIEAILKHRSVEEWLTAQEVVPQPDVQLAEPGSR